jgi:hypothetical protein
MSSNGNDTPNHLGSVEQRALAIVRNLPGDLLESDTVSLVTAAYAAVLAEDGCFKGMRWPDAKAVAEAIARAITYRTDAVDVLLNRARDVLAGADGVGWVNRPKAAEALRIAARGARIKGGRVKGNRAGALMTRNGSRVAAGAALAMVLVALLWLPVAHADEHGPSVSDIVCQKLAKGFTPTQVAEQLQGGSPAVSRLSAVETVTAAAQWCGPTFRV